MKKNQPPQQEPESFSDDRRKALKRIALGVGIGLGSILLTRPTEARADYGVGGDYVDRHGYRVGGDYTRN